MCGIVGYFDKQNLNYQNINYMIDKMNTLQSHRGPDSSGQFINAEKTTTKSMNIMDHLENIRRQKAEPATLEEEFNKNRQKYKKIEEVLPLFPLTILIQKRRVEKIRNVCPELFDTNKESLSFFD